MKRVNVIESGIVNYIPLETNFQDYRVNESVDNLNSHFIENRLIKIAEGFYACKECVSAYNLKSALDMKKIMEKIMAKMAEEGKPMIKLAGLFIDEPLSLEILLMLESEGPMTVEQISNEMKNDVVKITDILDKLKGFKTIEIKENLVNLTERGQCIVIKLRMSMTMIKK